jgi:hypothetical protein
MKSTKVIRNLKSILNKEYEHGKEL